MATCAAVLLPVPARAVPVGTLSAPCGFSHVSPGYYHGRYHAEVDSDPVVVTRDGAPASGRITCTFQTGADRTHAGADAAAAASPTTTGVVVLPPTGVSFEPGRVSLCSEVTIDGDATYYYDDDTGAWSTDPNVPCWTQPISVLPPHAFGELLIGATDVVGGTADPAVCPVLGDPRAPRDPDGLLYVDAGTDLYAGSWLLWRC